MVLRLGFFGSAAVTVAVAAGKLGGWIDPSPTVLTTLAITVMLAGSLLVYTERTRESNGAK